MPRARFHRLTVRADFARLEVAAAEGYRVYASICGAGRLLRLESLAPFAALRDGVGQASRDVRGRAGPWFRWSLDRIERELRARAKEEA